VTERVDPAARILAIQVARIGDTLLVTPALRALKDACPQGRLAVLAHPKRHELLQGLPFIDELGAITAKTAWWRGRFGGKRWDYALVHGHDAPLLRYAARVAQRVIAFDQNDPALNKILWRTVAATTHPIHAVTEQLRLANELGVTARDTALAYAVSPAERVEARRWIDEHLPPGAFPLVGFQAASFPTKAYRDWPIESFAGLGEKIFAAYPNAHVLVLGGPESRAKATMLARQLGRATAVAGRFRLRQTAALLAHMHLYVGVDTGPTHLAGALRIPMVAMYHCRHRGKYLAPLQHEHLRIIEHPASDASCSTSSPMSEISIDQVWTHVQALLG